MLLFIPIQSSSEFDLIINEFKVYEALRNIKTIRIYAHVEPATNASSSVSDNTCNSDSKHFSFLFNIKVFSLNIYACQQSKKHLLFNDLLLHLDPSGLLACPPTYCITYWHYNVFCFTFYQFWFMTSTRPFKSQNKTITSIMLCL